MSGTEKSRQGWQGSRRPAGERCARPAHREKSLLVHAHRAGLLVYGGKLICGRHAVLQTRGTSQMSVATENQPHGTEEARSGNHHAARADSFRIAVSGPLRTECGPFCSPLAV